jgi:hypothetical protein
MASDAPSHGRAHQRPRGGPWGGLGGDVTGIWLRTLPVDNLDLPRERQVGIFYTNIAAQRRRSGARFFGAPDLS